MFYHRYTAFTAFTAKGLLWVSFYPLYILRSQNTLVLSQKLQAVHAVLIFLVSPSDWGLPLALESVRRKLSPRIRSKCLQSSYKITSRHQYLNSISTMESRLT